MPKKPLVVLASKHEHSKVKSSCDNLTYIVTSNKKPDQTNVDDGLVELVEALEGIDENGPLAKTNATSISDCNGGRILL